MEAGTAKLTARCPFPWGTLDPVPHRDFHGRTVIVSILSLKTAGKTPSPPLEVRRRHFSRLIGTVPNEQHRVPLPDHAYGHTAIAHNRGAGVRWNPTAPQPSAPVLRPGARGTSRLLPGAAEAREEEKVLLRLSEEPKFLQ